MQVQRAVIVILIVMSAGMFRLVSNDISVILVVKFLQAQEATEILQIWHMAHAHAHVDAHTTYGSGLLLIIS